MKKLVFMIMVLLSVVAFVGCDDAVASPKLTDPNPKIETENIIYENVITENVIN